MGSSSSKNTYESTICTRKDCSTFSQVLNWLDGKENEYKNKRQSKIALSKFGEYGKYAGNIKSANENLKSLYKNLSRNQCAKHITLNGNKDFSIRSEYYRYNYAATPKQVKSASNQFIAISEIYRTLNNSTKNKYFNGPLGMNKKVIKLEKCATARYFSSYKQDNQKSDFKIRKSKIKLLQKRQGFPQIYPANYLINSQCPLKS